MTRIQRGAALLRWRRQRQGERRRWPTLNLVALMDVFTILVFFFLVHSSDGAPGERNELLELPESHAELPPRDTPVVTITLQSILIEGEPVAVFDVGLGANDAAMEALLVSLKALRNKQIAAGSESAALTIEGDRKIPFKVLNSIMRTCTLAGFGDISLSVRQLSRSGGVAI
jgi:biopolymer transport protein ExbD